MKIFVSLFVALALMSTSVASETWKISKRVNCKIDKCVALTFDDGPGPYTEQLLNILKKHKAKATFYVVGRRIKKHPELIRRMVAEKHQIGNHTWNHPYLTKISSTSIQRQILSTSNIVSVVTGGYIVRSFRPPYGSYSQRVINNVGIIPTMWDIDTLDWKYRNRNRIAAIANRAVAGDIILLHDIHRETVAAVPIILKNLSARGFIFVRVEDLPKKTLASR
ncbi:MAG: peptidoglycan/xylan/chitin deacetylase (PgdA/CDA1 family) [Acidimicrobiales bacterium]|jgi:peptidoglycan/xylan/chitin deacetylase (PgdA/CDA1 family)